MTTSNASRRSARYAFATITVLTLVLSLAQPASAGTASKLEFGVQPTGTTAGLVIAPAVTVRVLDQQDNLVTDSTLPVTLSLSSGGALFGTTKQNAVGGTATFSDLRVIPAGTYTLRAVSIDSVNSKTSSAFTITGAGVVCGSGGCPTVNDPTGSEPTKNNSTTGTIQVPTCPGAGTQTDFVSYDESAASFCAGGCLGAAVFFASDCDSGDPWLIIYRLDKSLLKTDKGAVHVQLYIEYPDGSVELIPDCVKQGILNPGPVCVSRQFKNGQGDSISEILKAPGDPKIAG